jgi:hypothetical protein
MGDTTDELAVELARLRRETHRPIGHARLAELEVAARASGRQLHVVSIEGDSDEAVLVLGWDGVEPAESTQAPKLPRRRLPPPAVKVLVVFHALISDSRTVSDRASTSAVEHALNRLAGPGAGASAERMLSTTLSRSGLVVRIGDVWARGPAVSAWDAPTRAVMEHTAERLWAHPLWPGAADE